MDKQAPYETFQFIESNNTDSDMNQLLVLQEDGTLLNENRDIQYITQVPDLKEDMGEVQTCAVMFDVSSQQFYVDVDNASNLIVPPDQFALQNSQDGSIYSSSFLIQPETNVAEPMEPDLNVPILKPDDEPQCETDKSTNNFTEITLTDAQYHLLEQKGWVLLEFSERIFVLDTVGLHDITTDEKLINKLKSELEGTAIEPEQSKTENVQNTSDMAKIEFKEPPVKENADEPGEIEAEQIISDNLENESHSQDNTSSSIMEHYNVEEDNESDKKCDSIKIKTRYVFSDIPDKIFLGKTANGKNLYAKITKSKHKRMNSSIKSLRKTFDKDKNVDAIDDVQFTNILQDYLREPSSKMKMCDVIAADCVVTQLLQMPHIRDTVMGRYIVVTKTLISVTEDGMERIKRKPITVTGEVKSLDSSHGRFVHTPFMLHNIACQESSKDVPLTKNTIAKITPEFVEFVHIHITETKVPGQLSSQSINVCNRKISLDVIRDAKKRHPNPLYACGACAAVFKTEATLTEHLENYCSGIADPDGTLTIDTDQVTEKTDAYYKLDTGKENWWYACMQCEEKFSKLVSCKRHIQSHIKPVKKSTEGDETEIKEYKCKMCPSKYFHASSLSKHIVKRHIQIQYNKNK